MTIVVCLGPTPDTWWQAKNAIGDRVLERAEQIAPDEVARKAISEGKLFQALNLNELAPPLKGRVWEAIEEAARQIQLKRPRPLTPGHPDGLSTSPNSPAR